ncbi:unnamed protein product [Pieris brassicae]|uniref:Nuclear receptor domain-containing protein n=1 Tax=Pieris brassicae TaxID=7116 RepID=A0A9P0TBX2_PIEBR|nr:unnamed protein product [Pieris brassicae]
MSPDSSYGRYDTPTPVDTNMMSPVHKEREPELHIEFDGTTVLCRVCGDKASGFHYGVHSCEGLEVRRPRWVGQCPLRPIMGHSHSAQWIDGYTNLGQTLSPRDPAFS